MQLAAAKNTATTEDEYLAVIRAKTAELFAAACEVGPALGGRPKDEQSACRSFGMNLGIAFQLVDDALDYGGKAAKLGKNVGDDFREGKITLPVVLSFRRGSESERAFWRRALEKGDATDADLEQAIALMTKHRALEDTVQRARHYGAIAKDALALFPASPMKEALEEAVEFCIARLELAAASSPRIHQSGFLARSARAAAIAARPELNSPKQVAPDPDMRASWQPPSARRSLSTSAMIGCSAIAGASRSLRSSADGPKELAVGEDRITLPCPGGDGTDAPVLVAGFSRSAANTSFVGTATPGLTRTAGNLGRSIGGERISPMPRIERGRGSRQTGTSAPVARAAAISRGSSSAMRLARARSRSAAAASAEPPPNPAATGSRFAKAKRPSFNPSTRVGQCPRSLEHEIVGQDRRTPPPSARAPRATFRAHA